MNVPTPKVKWTEDFFDFGHQWALCLSWGEGPRSCRFAMRTMAIPPSTRPEHGVVEQMKDVVARRFWRYLGAA